MSTLLIISSIVLGVGGLLMIVGLIKKIEGMVYGGTVLGVFALLFGFVMVGLFNTPYIKVEEAKVVEFIKSDYTVFVRLEDDKFLQYDKKFDYDNIDSETKFYKITTYNHYYLEMNVNYSNELKYSSYPMGETIKK